MGLAGTLVQQRTALSWRSRCQVLNSSTAPPTALSPRSGPGCRSPRWEMSRQSTVDSREQKRGGDAELSTVDSRLVSSQLLQQRRCVRQVLRIKSLGEATVDLGQQLPRLPTLEAELRCGGFSCSHWRHCIPRESVPRVSHMWSAAAKPSCDWAAQVTAPPNPALSSA